MTSASPPHSRFPKSILAPVFHQAGFSLPAPQVLKVATPLKYLWVKHTD